MKKLTKSILSPFRSTTCISFSFFRCSKTTPSQKSKKKGSAVENHEPSSPKVTCIGQVRVKSKRSGKKSKRRKKNGEVSFRKINEQLSSASGSQECRNQRWVLLPISVCEALRGFGSDFKCLFPSCKSCCFSTRKRNKRKTENGCGVMLPRWLVAAEDGGVGRRREIEVVVDGGEDEEEEVVVERRPSIRSSRRHVFEDFEIKEDDNEEDEEEGRVSICIPPKNALLLMRCRSDPVKMAASFENHRFSLDSNALPRFENGENYSVDFEKKLKEDTGKEIKNAEDPRPDPDPNPDTKQDPDPEPEQEEEEEVESNMSSFEALLEQENAEEYSIQEKEDEKKEEESVVKLEPKNQQNETPLLPECLLLMMCEPKLSMEVSKETWVRGADFIRWLPERPRKVAKAVKTGGGCEHESVVKKKPNVEAKIKPNIPVPPARKNEQHPPRSSCSLPAGSMVTVNGVAQEPVGLTRCKSEPMRTAAAKLMPESCAMNVESQSRGAVGVEVGAAGLGF